MPNGRQGWRQVASPSSPRLSLDAWIRKVATELNLSGSLQGCDASALPSELDDLSGVLRELLQRGAVFAPMRCSPLGRFTQQLREWSLSASQGCAVEEKATCDRSPFPCPLLLPESERRQHDVPASGRRRTSFGQELSQILGSPAGVASGMLGDKASSTLDSRAVGLHAEAKVFVTSFAARPGANAGF